MLACGVRVYVCLHVHIYMYRLCGRIDGWMEVRVHICFTCVFHRCFRIDSWMRACVCVCVCVYMYISMCIAGVVGVKSASAHMFLHVCFIGA
jgi:hypothetical protein